MAAVILEGLTWLVFGVLAGAGFVLGAALITQALYALMSLDEENWTGS